jgi:transketolase
MGAASTTYCFWQGLRDNRIITMRQQPVRAESGVSSGAYMLAKAPNRKLGVLLQDTGSEVSLWVTTCEQLRSEGKMLGVISMLSWELFEHQRQEYHDSLPPEILLG